QPLPQWSASSSANGTPSRAASARPTVDFPEPGTPCTDTRCTADNLKGKRPGVAGALVRQRARKEEGRYGPETAASVAVEVDVPAYALPGIATWIVGVTSTLPRPVFSAEL